MVNSFIELLIKDKIIPDESKEIYLYGIYVIVFNLIVVVDILLIGFILNQLKYSIYFLIFWMDMEIHLVKRGKATYNGEITMLLGSHTGRGAVRPGGRHV